MVSLEYVLIRLRVYSKTTWIQLVSTEVKALDVAMCPCVKNIKSESHMEKFFLLK